MSLRRSDIPNRDRSPSARKSYGENDLAEALGPVGKVVASVFAAKADLDKLVEAVRTKAKAK
jgi:hypothetical protein